DLSFGGAEGAPQADFRAAFKDADEHDVCNADGADKEGDGAESEEQAVEGALCFGAGGEGGGGLADVGFVGRFGGGGGGQERMEGGGLAGDGAGGDRGRGCVEVGGSLGGGEGGGEGVCGCRV